MGAPGATDLQRRALFTLALLAGYVAATRIPSLGLDLESIPEFADRTGAFALGVRPALSAYMLVEFLAWAVPRWRKLRESNQGRDVLERQCAIVTILFAIFQGFGVAKMLQGLTDEFATHFMTPPLESPALVMVSMVVGAGVTLAIARFITRLGLLNGFVALTLVETGMAIASWRGTDAYDAVMNAFNAPLVVAAAFVLPVVATVLLIAMPPNRGADLDIPPPASSLEPVAVAGAVIAIPTAFFGDASVWSSLGGVPDSRLWLHLLTAVVVGFSSCALFTLPEPLASVLANTGMRHARATRIARAAAYRAALPAALFVLVLAACDYTAYNWVGLRLFPVSLALAAALVVDTRVALLTRSEGGWVRVFRDPRPQLVAVAAEQLTAKGIEPRIGTRAQSALLRAFGAYACSEILVQKADSERASKIVHRLFTGPPDEAPAATSNEDAAPEADTSPETNVSPNADAFPETNASSDAEASPNAGASTNAFAPPTADEHERRPILSTLELRLAILALAAIVAPALAD